MEGRQDRWDRAIYPYTYRYICIYTLLNRWTSWRGGTRHTYCNSDMLSRPRRHYLCPSTKLEEERVCRRIECISLYVYTHVRIRDLNISTIDPLIRLLDLSVSVSVSCSVLVEC